jgi:ABC-type dipeptide/oligopeptide/nickel transport system permease component
VTAYAVRRLLLLPFTLWAVSFTVFVLLRAVPGDPVVAIVGEKASPAVRERVRRERGFDRPILVQYGVYLGRLLQGDLGESYKSSGDRVSEQIRRRLPPTIELAVAALLLALAAGGALGVLSAVYRGTWIDYATATASLAGLSVPVFWLGFLLLFVLGGIFPTGGNLGVRHSYDPLTGFLLVDTLVRGQGAMFIDGLRHLALPAVALATIPTAMTARITRAALLEILGSDFVRTARAKGVPSSRVVLVHALRNALIPIVTLVGLEFGYLLGGAVLTETVFNRIGMGTFILDSVRNTEYDSIGGAVLVLALLFVAVNLAVDLLYAVIDPRVRHG